MQSTTLLPPQKGDASVEPLRADDFRRLGLGLSEARVAVIRRAARQRASSVTARAETTTADFPGDETVTSEAELAQVVTSVYRLLDPRRRQDLVQRVQLVRAEPTPVRTWLWGDFSQAEVQEAENQAANNDPGDDDWMLAMLAELQTDAKPATAASSTTRNSPASRLARDLPPELFRRSLRRRVLNWAANNRLVWFGILTAGTAILTGLLLLVLLVAFRQPASRASQPTAADSQFAAGDNRVTSANQTTPAAATAVPPVPAETPAGTDATGSLNSPTEPQPNQPEAPTLPIEPEPSNDSAVVEPALTDGPAVTDGPDMADDLVGPADADESPDGLVSPTVLEDVPSPMNLGRTTPLGDLLDADLAQVVKHPLPPADEIAQARQTLRESLLRNGPIAAGGLPPAIALWQRTQTARGGTAAQVALGLATAEQAVLIGKPEVAWEVLGWLTERYEAERMTLATDLLIDLETSAVTVAERERACRWALRLSDQQLLSEQFTAAAATALRGTSIAAGLNDELLRSRFRQRRDAITTAERLAENARESMARAPVELANRQDAAMVARHLCLNMRDWQQGLAWLAKAGISRLSKCAQDELVFHNAGQVSGISQLADSWLEAADSQRGGRMQDSLLLHARQLLSDAAQQSNGLERLEIEKQLRELDQELPSDLLPWDLPEARKWLQDNTAAAAIGGAAIGTAANNGAADNNANNNNAAAPAMNNNSAPLADPETLGALARLAVDGQATGVGLRFSPATPLPRSAIDEALNLQAIQGVSVQLEAHGYLAIAAATKINIAMRGPGSIASQPGNSSQPGNVLANRNSMSLAIDGAAVSWLPPEAAGNKAAGQVWQSSVELSVGLHRIVWQVSGEDFPGCQLVFRDAQSGQLLPLRHDDETKRAVARTPISVWAEIRSK